MSPAAELRAVVQQAASGEFICATADSEIHVYLQRGRVAWATVSSCPFEFSRFIRERCGIDDESFRSAVEECRRSKLPLGETLVAWGLASRQDVRDAIEHQLRIALAELAAANAGQTMFLERRNFAAYNPALTFELEECLRRAASAPPPRRTSAPPSGGRDTTPSLVLGSVGPISPLRPAPPVSVLVLRNEGPLARELLAEVPGAIATAVVRGGVVEECAGEATGAEIPHLPADLDFMALRTPDHSWLGLRSQDDAALAGWWRFDDAAFTGVVGAALAQRELPPVPSGPRSLPTRARVTPWEYGATDLAGGALREVLGYHLGVLGALVLDTHGKVRAAIGGRCPQHELTAVAHRYTAVLAGSPPARGDASAMGFHLRTLLAGSAAQWVFGGELVHPEAATLWLVLERDVPQGLGWACLAALTRALTRAPERERMVAR